MTITNLWPKDFPKEAAEEHAPVNILKAQAAMFTDMMKGELYARVETASDKQELIHSFYIIAPALDSFRQKIFFVKQSNVVKLWPVSCERISSPRNEVHLDANSEDEFMQILREIFSHEETKDIISKLLLQSRA